MTSTNATSPRVGPFGFLVLVYNVLAFAYSVWGASTGKGLAGLIMDYELRWFGEFSEKMTWLLVFLLLSIPSWALALKFGRTPAQASSAPLQAGDAAVSAVSGSFPAAQPRAPRRWLMLAVVVALAGGIPEGIYLNLERIDTADHQSTIHELDLGKSDALPSGDVRFVAVTGYEEVDRSFALTTTINGGLASGWDVTPLVPPAWHPDQPVRFLRRTYGDNSVPTWRGSPFAPPAGRSTLYARIARNDLPVYVERFFSREGLTLASPYYVLEGVSVEGGRVASTIADYAFLPWLALGLGLVALAPGAVVVHHLSRGARAASVITT